MRKISAFVLAVLATAFITLTAFDNQHSRAISKNASFNQREMVHITFYRNATRAFTAHGAINTAGTWTMQVESTGKAFHCVNTLTAPEGTIVALSNCNRTTMNGVWHIVDATGAFAGLEGNGSLMMLSYGEEWDGTIK